MRETVQAFAAEIYQQHLEESSFLYEQRLSLLNNPEITWQDIDDFEQRFETHIDGLVVGEEHALGVCKKQVTEGDFGELHAAVRVFCRQNRFDLLQEVLDKLDPEDEERKQAVSDALNHEFPEDWRDEFTRMLANGSAHLSAVGAKLLGFQRESAGHALLNLLRNDDAKPSPELIWALGRVKEKSARDFLFNYLKNEDEPIRKEAALALLRLGDREAVNFCQREASSESGPFIALGLGGNRNTTRLLLQVVGSERVTPDCEIALGLLGDISAVEVLIKHLSNEELAESAAQALNLITGTEIYEEVFIPEEIDEDELFEEELEKLKKGEPLYPEGEEPGMTITRLSQNPEAWQKWWMENQANFDPEIRYRNGKPYSPACLLENLESEKSPRLVRQLAYEELVIRYGVDFPFETDMFVVQQKKALARYAQWVKENGSSFQEGQWYFAGQMI